MSKQILGHIGHFNRGTRDHDSIVTGFGSHDRVMACNARDGELYARVDHKWGLRVPSALEVLIVARKHQGVTGRWVLDRVEPWASGESTDFFFKKSSPS